MNYYDKYIEFHIKNNLEQALLKLNNPIILDTIKRKDKEDILNLVEEIKQQVSRIKEGD